MKIPDLLKIAPSLCLIALACGCASTFHREAAMKELCDLTPSREDRHDQTEASKPPFRLAVYWDMETIDSSGKFINKRHWENSDGLVMVPFLNQLKKKNIITDFFLLPYDRYAQKDIDSIIKQAEKDNATALLCIRSVTFVDWYYNPAGLLDLTILGAFWFPGSNRDALVLLRCDFWDLSKRKCFFSLYSEGEKRTVGPTFIISSTPAFNKAKLKALYNMMKALNQQIHPSFDIKLLK